MTSFQDRTQDESVGFIGQVIGGNFRIDRLIGSGATGNVYQAEQLSLGKAVAVKVLHPHLMGDDKLVRRFQREAKSASRLNHPNSVQIQGLPGEVYSRTPQIRLGKIFKSDAVNVDVAVAALRSPDRASSTPDGQAGIKLSINHWKAWHTGGSASSGLDAAQIGVSVDGRRFSADAFPAQNKQVTRNGYGLSIDALIPIVAATKESRANALTLTGSFVTGAGIADQYTSLNGGVSNPAVPNPTMAATAPTYTPNIDSGLAMFYANGDGTYSLHPIQWTSEIVGLQYYLPPSGRLFLSVNYSHMSSGNVDDFGAHNKTFNASQFADLNVFFDLTPAVRFGLEGAYIDQTYTDGTDATDYRAQLSAFFIF